MSEEKICSKCEESYPNTSEYFHKSKGGLLGYCKLCRNRQQNEYYQKTHVKRLETKKEYRKKNKEILNRKSKIYKDNFRETHEISNSGIHSYIKKRKTKSKRCDLCGEKGELELSNISGEYKKDINDWQWVHHRCHMRFDLSLKKLPKVKS